MPHFVDNLLKGYHRFFCMSIKKTDRVPKLISAHSVRHRAKAAVAGAKGKTHRYSVFKTQNVISSFTEDTTETES